MEAETLAADAAGVVDDDVERTPRDDLRVEQLEAARYLPFLKKGGRVVTSTQRIDPMPVITGAAQYPEGLIDRMKEAGAEADDRFKTE